MSARYFDSFGVLIPDTEPRWNALYVHVADFEKLARELEEAKAQIAADTETVVRLQQIANNARIELSAAQAEAREAKRDAERYRWLRDTQDISGTMEHVNGGWVLREGEELDAAIDTAIAEPEKEAESESRG